MAMAAATPGIQAVGVDLAAEPIAEATAAAAEIGLRNVEFRQGGRARADRRSLGEFDYIVAHGVYGWIPEDARDALLDVDRHLALAGRPGVRVLQRAARRVLPAHAARRRPVARARRRRRRARPAEKAQELYLFLKEQRMTTADTYGALLEREVPMLADAPIYRLVHDDLSEFWHPVWFAEFAEHAARHGLGYVGEADLFGLRTEMLPEGVEPEVWKLAGGDRIAFENYSDLLTARHFRQSVLCHADEAVPASIPIPSSRPAAALGGAPEGRAARGRTARRRVRRARPPPPAGRRLRRAARRARRRPGRAGRGADRRLPARAPDPHAGPLRAASDPGERPIASPLARWQAAKGAGSDVARLQTVRMEEPAARLLITLLDGTRDRAAIRAELQARAGLEFSAEDLDANLVELARCSCSSRTRSKTSRRGVLFPARVGPGPASRRDPGPHVHRLSVRHLVPPMWSRLRAEAGQTAAEYLGGLLIVSVIIAAVAMTRSARGSRTRWRGSSARSAAVAIAASRRNPRRRRPSPPSASSSEATTR